MMPTKIYKILNWSGKKKLYETEKAFEKNWKFHCQSVNRPVFRRLRAPGDEKWKNVAFELKVKDDGSFYWEKIREY